MLDRSGQRVALFDVCQTLVSVTTIVDFTENFLLSRRYNSHFLFRKWMWHYSLKFLRRLHIIQPDYYRQHLFRLYAGYGREQLVSLCRQYNRHLETVFNTDVKNRFDQLKSEGYRVILVSAGLNLYLEQFAKNLDVDLVCTTLAVDDTGTYTGSIVGMDCIGEGKVASMHAQLPFFDDIDWIHSYAFGDSRSDIPLLTLVGNAHVINPDRNLENIARQNKWQIVTTSSR